MWRETNGALREFAAANLGMVPTMEPDFQTYLQSLTQDDEYFNLF